MAVYQWGFKIDSLPAPPSGYDKASPPPAPSVIGTSNLRLLDLSSPEPFSNWMLDNHLAVKNGGFRKPRTTAVINGVKETVTPIEIAVLAETHRNVDIYPWDRFLKGFDLPTPPTVSVKLTAVAVWRQLFTEDNRGNESDTETHEVKTGVTTTDSETKSFSETLGAEFETEFGPISGSLSAEFTRTSSYTHSISVSREETVRHTFLIPANTFVQVWQLFIQFQIENGPTIEHATRQFRKLTYPESSETAPTEGNVENMVKALLQSPGDVVL